MMADLIDRKSVIDVIHKAIFDFFDMVDDDDESPMTYKDEQLLTLNKAIVTKIKALPSAQPEREKGIWINKGRIVRCNKCKIGYATVKGMKSALTYNFCPNCGADMRGEQDG